MLNYNLSNDTVRFERVGKRVEPAFDSLLCQVGYSERAKKGVWNWYTFSTRERQGSQEMCTFAERGLLKLVYSVYEKGSTTGFSNPEKWR